MKSVRIGNDITVEWSIFNDGEPFIIPTKDTKVYINNPFERIEVKSFSIEDNKIMFVFYGKDQKHLGRYNLELCINEGENGMITTDACDFVKLVYRSCNATDEEDTDGLEIETVTLESSINALIGGLYDDTELREAIAMRNVAAVSRTDNPEAPEAPAVSGGLKYSIERELYIPAENEELTEEQKAYNAETYRMCEKGMPVTCFFEGEVLHHGDYTAEFVYQQPHLLSFFIQIESDGSVSFKKAHAAAILYFVYPEYFTASYLVYKELGYTIGGIYPIHIFYKSTYSLVDELVELDDKHVFGFTNGNERIRLVVDKESGEILEQEVIQLGASTETFATKEYVDGMIIDVLNTAV